MKILCDTLQKAGKHRNIQAYCDRHCIEMVNQRLNVGDYMIPGGKIAVDTKSGLQECATNLLNRSDASRFWREARRARKLGLKLVVLVEEHGIRSVMDVPKWKPKYGRATGRAIQTEMIRLEQAYGVVWKFCAKQSTGKRLIDILTEKEGA